MHLWKIFQDSLQGLRTGKNCRTPVNDDLANQGIFHACLMKTDI